MKIQSQLLIAETFGMIDYEQGVIKAPCQSKELMKMLDGRKIGQTPENEASSIEIMKSWEKGWYKAHRVAMKAKFGF